MRSLSQIILDIILESNTLSPKMLLAPHYSYKFQNLHLNQKREYLWKGQNPKEKKS